MSTVVRRTFRSTPAREAQATWAAIVDLLTQGKAGGRRDELLRVSGIAASVIADHASAKAAIVVTCDGPRTRIYCLFDEDAIDGGDADEQLLGFDALKGDWHVSLPCTADDLGWVQKSLKDKTSRVSARDLAEAVTPDSESAEVAKTSGLVLDIEGVLRP